MTRYDGQTEEELAALLGLTETGDMRAARDRVMRSAPRDSEPALSAFAAALTSFQQLGEAAADARDKSDRIRIALILLTARVWRDVAESTGSPLDAQRRKEELRDALTYAEAAAIEEVIVAGIRCLLAGPSPH